MQIMTNAIAGTMESSDIMVTIAPKDTPGVELNLESSVLRQFGRQLEKVIRETLAELGVEAAIVTAVDKGALDCTVRARTAAAAYRAAQREDYTWRANL